MFKMLARVKMKSMSRMVFHAKMCSQLIYFIVAEIDQLYQMDKQ